MNPNKGVPRAPIRELPSQEVLNRLFDYDAETGLLRWRPRPGVRGFKCNAGQAAGTVTNRGYLSVIIDKKKYYAHRLIWKLVTGRDPESQVDHIDGDRLNNRWSNLRAADNRRNRWNARTGSNNTTGFKGVHFRAACTRRPWVAVLALGAGKYRRLGYFETPEEASSAWQAAAQKQREDFFRAA